MDCCGHGYALTPRHWILSTAMASVGAMLTGHVGPSGSTAAAQTAETASAALDVVRKSISVDVHTHGGKTGITSKAPPNDEDLLTFARRRAQHSLQTSGISSPNFSLQVRVL